MSNVYEKTLELNEESKEKAVDDFANAIDKFKIVVLANNIEHGFWEGPGEADADKFAPYAFNKSEKLMLMVTELAEACEALRHGNPPDDKLPQYAGDGVELADCIIRIMDYCAAYNIPIGEIIKAKHEYNVKRPYKHGKKF